MTPDTEPMTPPPGRATPHPGRTTVPIGATTPGPGPTTPAAGDPARSSGRTAAANAWAEVPLRTRLTVLLVALLGAGLVLGGITAQALLSDSLVGQIDRELARAAPALAGRATGGLPVPSSPGDRPLTTYHLTLLSPTGDVQARWPTDSATTGPRLPAMTTEDVLALDGEPVTLPDAGGDGRWRVLTGVRVDPRGVVVDSIAVALPMTSADATLAQMRTSLVLIGLSVVALAAAGAWWGVRRALRPLHAIEDTAAAIAAGDLGRRVPPAPTSTEVGRLSQALNGMLAQIEQAFEARAASEERMRRFVADASHELRTPLATIRGYGELYRMGALTTPEEVDRTIRHIEDSAVRMGSMVEDLLHLARLDERRPDRREPVDLAVLASDAVADLRALDPTRPARVVPLQEGGSVGGAVALGDEGRLRQVVANLIGNVVRHTPGGTPVEVAVGLADDAADGTQGGGAEGDVRATGGGGADGRRAVIEVRDHGPGVDPDHASRVFERFYRVDAGRNRATGGAGLGLAIVAAIVEAHGGTATLRPTPGGGTTVRVNLPAAAGHPSPEYYDDESFPDRP